MKRALVLALSVGLWTFVSACQQSGGPLKVDGVEPPQGTTAGGEEISINGGGFQPGKTQAEVRFGRKKAESVIIASTNKIRVVTPANEKGPVDVSVMFDDGAAFKIPNAFHYVEPAANDNTRQAFFGGQQNTAAKIEVDKKQ
jgi:hypothetical protein